MSNEFPVPMRGVSNVMMWAHEHEVDAPALNQLRRMSGLRGVEAIKVMPDVHVGKGAVVGSVIATKDTVAPNAVGTDLGCGMVGLRTSLMLEDLPDDLHSLRLRIEEAIPVGSGMHPDGPGRALGAPGIIMGHSLDTQVVKLWKEFDTLHANINAGKLAKRQLSTLGGGNHFIEVTADQSGRVWLQLHSGSRAIGKMLAETHIKIAKSLDVNKGLSDPDLAVFLAGSTEMTNYLEDLGWAQRYASISRMLMMLTLADALKRAVGRPVAFDHLVNCHHNYVTTQWVDGQKMVVTRKGAISAASGELGMIPGSLGTGSFIVSGLGNPQSLASASHGAGRKLSRGSAKERFSLEDVFEQTRGVECRKDAGMIDELPGAYKDISEVIRAQDKLVKVVAQLETLLCVKG